MWIRLDTKEIIREPKPITIDGIQYPKEIFDWPIDKLVSKGIKYFREERFDSSVYYSIGYTDSETSTKIRRSYTLEYTDDYLNNVRSSQVEAIKNDMDIYLSLGVICSGITVSGVKMDAYEEDAVRMKHGIELAELNEEDYMNVIDYNNEVHFNVPMSTAVSIAKQQGDNYREAFFKRAALRTQIYNTNTVSGIRNIVW
jgi:hypothetical protein